MAEVKLSESLGAMALIDELRHRQMAVNELLDLPRRRQEVAEHVRQYYTSQNIVVDDALIEQGVRAFFEHRLEFDPGERDTWRRRFAERYVQWRGRPVAADRPKSPAPDRVAQPVGARPVSRQPVQKRLPGLLLKGLAILGIWLCLDWYNGTGIFAPDSGTSVQLVLGDTPTTLAEASRQFGVMQASPDYVRALQMLASLRSADDKARLALARVLSEGDAPAVLAIAELAQQAPGAVQLSQRLQQIQTAAARLLEMQPSPRQQAYIAELARRAQSKAESGISVSEELKVLQGMLVFAETAVSVRMAPTFWNKLSSLGLADHNDFDHFLLAEAVDEKGTQIAIPVQKERKLDEAGGAVVMAKEFAVQVSEQEMKNQEGMFKLSGKIVNPVLGRKAAGVLAVTWERNVLPDPALLEGLD